MTFPRLKHTDIKYMPCEHAYGIRETREPVSWQQVQLYGFGGTLCIIVQNILTTIYDMSKYSTITAYRMYVSSFSEFSTV